MFKKLSYLGTNLKYIYLLEDTDFTCQVSVSCTPLSSPNGAATATAVIAEYKGRNLPVARNVALHYVSEHIAHLIEEDKHRIDLYHPELEYGVKYFRCVKTQIKRLTNQSPFNRRH